MKRFVLPLLLLASSASAAVYSYPSDYFPAVGDTVFTVGGSSFEITGSCTITAPDTGIVLSSQLQSWGVVPCHDFVKEESGLVKFMAQGLLDNKSTPSCIYQEYFYCPGTPATSQEVPLDISKAISFLLGGLTGLGFVLASSARW